MHSYFNYINDIVLKNEYEFQNTNNSLGISICQLCNVSIHSLFYIHCSTYILPHTLINICIDIYTYTYA